MSDSADELLADGYQEACAVDEVPNMMPRKVQLSGRSVLVCKDGAEIFAVDEICPHKNKSMAYGVIHHGKITCPHHQYDFELASGKCKRRRCAPVMTYPVRVVDEVVYVQVN